jgi:hypothetical protein
MYYIIISGVADIAWPTNYPTRRMYLMPLTSNLCLVFLPGLRGGRNVDLKIEAAGEKNFACFLSGGEVEI